MANEADYFRLRRRAQACRRERSRRRTSLQGYWGAAQDTNGAAHARLACRSLSWLYEADGAGDAAPEANRSQHLLCLWQGASDEGGFWKLSRRRERRANTTLWALALIGALCLSWALVASI
jgi:hypothetical protein